MPSVAPIALVVPPRATCARTSTSRTVRPAGAAGRLRTRWPSAANTASTAAPSSVPALAASRNSAAAACRVSARPVRAILDHRVVAISRREHLRQHGRSRSGRFGIAAAVGPFVGGRSDRCQQGELPAAVQHPVGVVRVEADSVRTLQRSAGPACPTRCSAPRCGRCRERARHVGG